MKNTSKSYAADSLSMIFEFQKSAFQLQNLWLELFLGAASSSNFVGEYKKVLDNCQSRGVQRNKRSYDQLDDLPTLYIDAINAIFNSYAPQKK